MKQVQGVLKEVGYNLDVHPIYKQLGFDSNESVDWEKFRQIVRLVAKEDPNLLETYRKLLDRRVRLVSKGGTQEDFDG